MTVLKTFEAKNEHAKAAADHAERAVHLLDTEEKLDSVSVALHCRAAAHDLLIALQSGMQATPALRNAHRLLDVLGAPGKHPELPAGVQQPIGAAASTTPRSDSVAKPKAATRSKALPSAVPPPPQPKDETRRAAIEAQEGTVTRCRAELEQAWITASAQIATAWTWTETSALRKMYEAASQRSWMVRWACCHGRLTSQLAQRELRHLRYAIDDKFIATSRATAALLTQAIQATATLDELDPPHETLSLTRGHTPRHEHFQRIAMARTLALALEDVLHRLGGQAVIPPPARARDADGRWKTLNEDDKAHAIRLAAIEAQAQAARLVSDLAAGALGHGRIEHTLEALRRVVLPSADIEGTTFGTAVSRIESYLEPIREEMKLATAAYEARQQRERAIASA